jgi:hypothetical protein
MDERDRRWRDRDWRRSEDEGRRFSGGEGRSFEGDDDRVFGERETGASYGGRDSRIRSGGSFSGGEGYREGYGRGEHHGRDWQGRR